MRRLCTLLLPLLAGLVLVHATPASAALKKVWVSNAGLDSASCGDVVVPCRTFQQAHDNLLPGGDIGVLTPGDYGNVLIKKSLTITNDGGGEAGVAVTLFAGLYIDAGPGGIVGLRGLIFEGHVGGGLGIQVFSASAVHIQNCVIRNYEAPGFGLLFEPNSNSRLFVQDTVISNNGSNATTGGIIIAPTGAASADVVLDRVRVENNVIGLRVDGSQSTGNGSHVVLRGSVVSGNVSDGIRAVTVAGKSPALILVERSSSVNNVGNGLVADGPHAVILLSDTTVSYNGTGVAAVNGGQLISYGNNRNNNNVASDGAATSFNGLF